MAYNARFVFLPIQIMQMNAQLMHPKQGRHRTRWTKDEDERLKMLVQRYGEDDWWLVAGYMRDRNARQCRERYVDYLSPRLHNDPWTPEEEAMLTEKVNMYGRKWVRLTSFFQARSAASLRNHWALMMHRNERIAKAQAEAEAAAAAKAAAANDAVDEQDMSFEFREFREFDEFGLFGLFGDTSDLNAWMDSPIRFGTETDFSM
jgi:hypothetical protein